MGWNCAGNFRTFVILLSVFCIVDTVLELRFEHNIFRTLFNRTRIL